MMYVFPFDVEFIARLGDNVIKIDRFWGLICYLSFLTAVTLVLVACGVYFY